MGVSLGSHPIVAFPVIVVVRGWLRKTPVKARYMSLARHVFSHLFFALLLFPPVFFYRFFFLRGGSLFRIVYLSCCDLGTGPIRSHLVHFFDSDTSGFVLWKGVFESDPLKPLYFYHSEGIQAPSVVPSTRLDPLLSSLSVKSTIRAPSISPYDGISHHFHSPVRTTSLVYEQLRSGLTGRSWLGSDIASSLCPCASSRFCRGLRYHGE